MEDEEPGEPIILDSGHRHGVANEEMLRALRFAIHHVGRVPEVILMRRSLTELIAKADELAGTFESYDPEPDDFDASLPPLMAVKFAAFRRAAAEKELAAAIHAARDAHLSWRELGEAIGTSGEAVRQRYAAS